jgi:hypothetical protein
MELMDAIGDVALDTDLESASLARCTTFLTNDRRIPPLAGIQVLQLDAFGSLSS